MTTVQTAPLPTLPSQRPFQPQTSASGPHAADLLALFDLPLPELLYRAQTVHRTHFDPAAVQLSTLLSIKTGGCSEDCGYCPQSAHHEGSVAAEKLMSVSDVIDAAKAAKAQGASRFCMGAAWRSPKERDMPAVTEMVAAVRDLGLETCMTLGMLSADQAQALQAAGLDYYNHNVDTAPDFYGQIVSTRQMDDRLETLDHVRQAGIKVCCGGIVGMGESRAQRAGLLGLLASMDPQPESVPINNLVQVPGTPLAGVEKLDPFEFVRTIAVARIALPQSMIRLSAGREEMDEALQAICLLAGANSIFYGEKLLTTGNPQAEQDRALLARLGITPMADVSRTAAEG